MLFDIFSSLGFYCDTFCAQGTGAGLGALGGDSTPAPHQVNS